MGREFRPSEPRDRLLAFAKHLPATIVFVGDEVAEDDFAALGSEDYSSRSEAR